MSGIAARSLQLAACALLLLAQPGCSWMHHGKHHASCREPPIGGGSKNLQPLQVPPGLDTPDTRNAIKVPALNEPERPRMPADPCLSQPPSFKS